VTLREQRLKKMLRLRRKVLRETRRSPQLGRPRGAHKIRVASLRRFNEIRHFIFELSLRQAMPGWKIAKLVREKYGEQVIASAVDAWRKSGYEIDVEIISGAGD
jgi:hypothetical protein